MFRIHTEPHVAGILKVYVDPHPLTGIRRHVGYCRPPETQWSLLSDHNLRPDDMPLLNDYMERLLRESHEGGDTGGERSPGDEG